MLQPQDIEVRGVAGSTESMGGCVRMLSPDDRGCPCQRKGGRMLPACNQQDRASPPRREKEQEGDRTKSEEHIEDGEGALRRSGWRTRSHIWMLDAHTCLGRGKEEAEKEKGTDEHGIPETHARERERGRKIERARGREREPRERARGRGSEMKRGRKTNGRKKEKGH